MTPSTTSWPNTSELNVVNAGAMPSGTSSSRGRPSKTGSSAWYARWRSNDEPRKPLISVPVSGNAKKNGGVCLFYYCPSEMHLQRLFHIRGVSENLKFPRKVLSTTIRMWCCKARTHMTCVLQSMYSLYGRANKHHWRCVHCRRHLMDSRDEDIFHIGINEIDSFDSEDNEEIEHVHRIDESFPVRSHTRTYHIPDSD